jgi:AcrR family transcriptional regulator
MISQKEIKYNRLMGKAEELFINLGYKGVSMDEIAKEAGISKMTIYRYFSSKEELFIKAILSLTNRTFLYVKEELEKIDGTLGKIDFLLNFSIEYSKKYSLVFYKDIMDNPYVLEKLMAAKIRMTKDIFEGIIINGMERGEIRKVDEKFISGMLITLMKGVDNDYINAINSKEELEDFTEKFYDFLKYGLLGGKNE